MVIIIPSEHDHSCSVHARLYTITGEHVQTVAEFSLDLVSPVEYLFRKLSANEFGKPQFYKLAQEALLYACLQGAFTLIVSVLPFAITVKIEVTGQFLP